MNDLLSGLIRLHPGAGEPLRDQLTKQLRSLITTGRLAPTQRLPSSRHLARSLSIGRNTVSFAIEQLAAEGYLKTSPGRRAVILTGVTLDARKPQRTVISRRATELTVSPWARSIRNASWPPIYSGRPRPFQPGLADEREFPHDVWARCLRRAARNVPVRGDRSYNGPALQEALQRHLAEHRGVKAKPGQIIMVPSAQAGLSLIAKVMIGDGDLAWIESPGYGGALAALQSAGAIVAGVPLDASGLALRERKDIPRIIFVTPSHQYPTGRLMPAARRLELLRFAAAVGAAIIEDDYDSEFHYQSRPVTALQGMGLSAVVLYVGTFSKSMFADIRLGYVIVPEGLIETFELAQRHMGLSAAMTMQDALAEFIHNGNYLAHVRKMTRLYKDRRDKMLGALASEAGDRLSVEIPAGGMQLLARCDGSAKDAELWARLLEAGIVARRLSSMVFHKSREQGLFLGFAAWNDMEIERAARLLGRIVR